MDTQLQRLLEHLKKGNRNTPIEALREFGIFRLAARINDLRARGYSIERELVPVKDRLGALKRVAEYRIEN